ncbi:hypothetical protein [Propionivibrio sp.]|uniref:hypothetical protein n=1 Tax=Propionivibrio sp. TaxID=2212460 RepID=UPI00260F10D1|nr:hypothetical protein [Propionivibrio sp.]
MGLSNWIAGALRGRSDQSDFHCVIEKRDIVKVTRCDIVNRAQFVACVLLSTVTIIARAELTAATPPSGPGLWMHGVNGSTVTYASAQLACEGANISSLYSQITANNDLTFSYGVYQQSCRGYRAGNSSWYPIWWTVQSWPEPGYTCPLGLNWSLSGTGWMWIDDKQYYGTWCTRPDCNTAQIRSPSSGVCVAKDGPKQITPPSCDLGSGNPINAGTGWKYQDESIYSDLTNGLDYRIAYGSVGASDDYKPVNGHGIYWSSRYYQQIIFGLNPSTVGPSSVSVLRASGRVVAAFRQGTSNAYLPEADILYRVLIRLAPMPTTCSGT